MANFASSVRFQVKTGQENAFLEAVMKFDASQHPGCISHQVIDAGNGRFQSNVNIGDKTGHDVGAKASQLRLI